jgi:hypothetical protein
MGPADRIDPNDFCRNPHACFRPRRGTYVASEPCARGDGGRSWGAYWFNWGFARFRLESPR